MFRNVVDKNRQGICGFVGGFVEDSRPAAGGTVSLVQCLFIDVSAERLCPVQCLRCHFPWTPAIAAFTNHKTSKAGTRRHNTQDTNPNSSRSKGQSWPVHSKHAAVNARSTTLIMCGSQQFASYSSHFCSPHTISPHSDAFLWTAAP